MAWTTPATAVTGDVITAAFWNTNGRDNLNYLKEHEVPTGAVLPFAGSSAPTGWLLCDGSAVSRTTYADLFSVIGTTYGAGDGSTTFNLPNLKGRIPVGRDAGQAEFDSLGETGGAKTHTLTVSELPAHTHNVGTLATGSAGEHNHFMQSAGAHSHGAYGNNGTLTTTRVFDDVNTNAGVDAFFKLVTNAVVSDGAHTHPTDTQSAHTHALSGATAAAGSGAAHNNLQPFIVLNYIIRY